MQKLLTITLLALSSNLQAKNIITNALARSTPTRQDFAATVGLTLSVAAQTAAVRNIEFGSRVTGYVGKWIPTQGLGRQSMRFGAGLVILHAFSQETPAARLFGTDYFTGNLSQSVANITVNGATAAGVAYAAHRFLGLTGLQIENATLLFAGGYLGYKLYNRAFGGRPARMPKLEQQQGTPTPSGSGQPKVDATTDSNTNPNG